MRGNGEVLQRARASSETAAVDGEEITRAPYQAIPSVGKHARAFTVQATKTEARGIFTVVFFSAREKKTGKIILRR